MRYFDHNASSPLIEAARLAWLDSAHRTPGNPSSPHRPGARADHALQLARETLATRLGAPAHRLVWTSGATEANNTALHHVAHTSTGDVWISALEHPCVLAAATRWFPGRVQLIPARPSGVTDLDWIADRLPHHRPALIAVMAANNETGVLQPWPDLLRLCLHHGVPFLCDAAQWLGKLPAAGLGDCDFVSGCAHKFGGPPGTGFLLAPPNLKPLLVGGLQEDGRRAGTENVPGAAGCAAALLDREDALARIPHELRQRDRDAFEARIANAIPGLQIVGRNAPRLWNTSALLLPPVDCRRRWVVRLDKLGFAVSTGSACSSGREKPSHVLQALGLDATGDRLVRVSAGWETSADDWSALADALLTVAAEFGVLQDPAPAPNPARSNSDSTSSAVAPTLSLPARRSSARTGYHGRRAPSPSPPRS
ncbi:MAG: aminotransferase class V-fold PLP-dependent enzyme [Verrucomicrobiae bacterium]|nr:aminotransferase class V-fold PLP-dependent enzyme [Verrucomicrobiae bacterium]